MPDIAAEKVNPLAMSDEDFLNQPLPGAEAIQEVPTDTPSEVVETPTEVETEVKTDPAESTEVETKSDVASTQDTPSKPGSNGGNVPTNSEVNQDSKKDEATASTPEAKPAGEAKDAQGKDQAGTPEAKPATQSAAVDYEAFYKQVMAPFKANGKMIELRDVNEAISLMQMGANYTRKMQDIQPHRKTLLMLEQNQLLDPAQLSFLIDLKNGDEKAIHKLLKDKGIDPMSIDTSEDSTYLGGNHQVSDEEARFHAALQELNSDVEGKTTLQTINSTWDKSSKEELWKDPSIMQSIHTQRGNGIYDRIVTEVTRQQTLGHLPADLKFIDAYRVVGERMQAAGAFADLVTPTSSKDPSPGSAAVTTPSAPVEKAPVATRVVTPKPAVSNSDQASAAAATRSTPRENKQVVNPLAMSDEDFLKLDQFRV
ncbi:hypothetical protein [Caballeronia sp. LZ034LL]|uniref:hypothetical protein n=1 Tax=Caballeronia sp. LZ034LL TaxID=3038567 RepID=UPI00285B1090|nr:hypothetical protein [Caballeronia sp. LZ034LL]MDR5839320.1 hypothetical protein [Caballeronia sp. LZ034LL]